MMNTFVQGSCSRSRSLHEMPRVGPDMEQIPMFTVQQHGAPLLAVRKTLTGVSTRSSNKRRIRHDATGIELRRHNGAQFSTIYAYTAQSASWRHI